jgi:hypothetical protein
LLQDPERLRLGLDEMIEQERAGMRGDPEQEERAWLDKLAEVEQERRGYLRLAAKGRITDEELDETLAELEEVRQTAERELAAIGGHRKIIGDLKRDRDALLESYARMVPEELDRLTPEERHNVYRMLRLEVYVFPTGDLDIRGAVLAGDGLYPEGNVTTYPREHKSRPVLRFRALLTSDASATELVEIARTLEARAGYTMPEAARQ